MSLINSSNKIDEGILDNLSKPTASGAAESITPPKRESGEQNIEEMIRVLNSTNKTNNVEVIGREKNSPKMNAGDAPKDNEITKEEFFQQEIRKLV